MSIQTTSNAHMASLIVTLAEGLWAKRTFLLTYPQTPALFCYTVEFNNTSTTDRDFIETYIYFLLEKDRWHYTISDTAPSIMDTQSLFNCEDTTDTPFKGSSWRPHMFNRKMEPAIQQKLDAFSKSIPFASDPLLKDVFPVLKYIPPVTF
jgi:hypothetical protein